MSKIKTGIIRGESNEYYHSLTNIDTKKPAIGSSSIKTATDPWDFIGKYITGEIQKPGDNDAFKIGNVFEELVSNKPEEYSKIYIVAPKCDKRTKVGKAKWAEFLQKSNGKYVLTQAEDSMIAEMVTSFFAHDIMSIIMEKCSPEFQVTFRHDAGAIFYQCKTDMLIENCISIPELGINEGDRVVIDLKTSKDSHLWNKKSIIDYRYDLQEAYYRQVMAICSHPPKHFLFCFTSKNYPHATQLIKIPDYVVEMSKGQVIKLIGDITQWFGGKLPKIPETSEIEITDWELKKMGLIEG